MEPPQAPPRPRGDHRRRLLTGALLGLACALCHPWRWPNFAGSGLAAPRAREPPSTLQAAGRTAEDYPELSRVEDLIYDSCMIMDGQKEVECLRVWDKLKKFHKASAIECSLDDMRCVVLDVLERLCEGINGREGLVLLRKVTAAILAFRKKFSDWDEAFAAADTSNCGALDLDDFGLSMESVGAKLSPAELQSVFYAADTNGDRIISPDEFSDFLTAGIFAEEPLRQLDVDSLPKKQVDVVDLLRWSSAGRTESWAGLGRL